MKLKEILARIDKTKLESWHDLQSIAEEFDIYQYFDTNQGRLKSYFYQNWYCTDSWVGGRIYFLDGEPVCVSWQSGRKSDEEFEWISRETFNKTKAYLLSLLIEEEKTIHLCDLEQEMGEGYQVEFSGQFLTQDVILLKTNEMVKIVECYTKESRISQKIGRAHV